MSSSTVVNLPSDALQYPGSERSVSGASQEQICCLTEERNLMAHHKTPIDFNGAQLAVIWVKRGRYVHVSWHNSASSVLHLGSLAAETGPFLCSTSHSQI